MANEYTDIGIGSVMTDLSAKAIAGCGLRCVKTIQSCENQAVPEWQKLIGAVQMLPIAQPNILPSGDQIFK